MACLCWMCGPQDSKVDVHRERDARGLVEQELQMLRRSLAVQEVEALKRKVISDTHPLTCCGWPTSCSITMHGDGNCLYWWGGGRVGCAFCSFDSRTADLNP